MLPKTRKVSPRGALSSNAHRFCTLPNLSLAFTLLCCLLIGAFEQYTSYFSIALLGVFLLNWNRDEFYLFSAVLLLYWEQFYLIAGSTPLYRVYSYLVMIRFFLDIGKVRFRPQFLPTLVVLVSFCVLAATRLSGRMAMMLMADGLLSYMVLIRLRQSAAMMRKLTVVFALTAVCAGVYGLLAGSMVSYGTGMGANEVEIVRYYGTLIDANYAGCFYNVAIFMVLCSDAFRKWYIRLPLLGVLVYFLLMTASQTALLCLGVCFGVYLILRYRAFGILLLVLYLLAALGVVFVLIRIPNPESLGPLSTIAIRLKATFAEVAQGDLSAATTNRTSLWEIAWDFYVRQSLYKKLLGGNVVTMHLSEQYWLDTVGAVHNSYVQGLLNFGMIGTVIIFGTRIIQTIADAIACLTRNESQLPVDINRCVVIISLIFLLYALTIDIFVDWRALYLYFM